MTFWCCAGRRPHAIVMVVYHLFPPVRFGLSCHCNVFEQIIKTNKTNLPFHWSWITRKHRYSIKNVLVYLYKGNTRGAALSFPLKVTEHKIKGVSDCSLKWLAMNASLLRKWGSNQKRKWEGVRGIVEEEEQWSEKWERYWGSLVRHLRGDNSVMMGEEASDGWDREREGNRKRDGGWGRAIVLFLTPPQKTPWQAVNQTASLDWFSPLFNQHFTLRPSLPSECALMPTLCIF